MIHGGLFTIVLYLISASIWLTSWMTSEFHSYVNLKVLFIFNKAPTSILSLVHFWNVLHDLHTCWFLPCLYDNNSSVLWTWLALSRYFNSGNYIAWPSVTLIYLNLGLMSDIGRSGHKSSRGPNMGRFSPSCVHLVYFLLKSKGFHVKRTECQIFIFHLLILIFS